MIKVNALLEIKLTIKQLKEMRHAIGGTITDTPYRNYFNIGKKEDNSWNELVDMNLAIKSTSFNPGLGVYYYLTDLGIKTLNDILKG